MFSSGGASEPDMPSKGAAAGRHGAPAPHSVAATAAAAAAPSYPHLPSYYGQYAPDPYAHAHAHAAAAAHHYPTSMDMAASWYAATNNSLGQLYRGYDTDNWASSQGVDPLAGAASGETSAALYNIPSSSSVARLTEPLESHAAHLSQPQGSPDQDIKSNIFRGEDRSGRSEQHQADLLHASTCESGNSSQATSSSIQQHLAGTTQPSHHPSPDSGLATSESGSPNNVPTGANSGTLALISAQGVGESSSSPRGGGGPVGPMHDLLVPSRPPSSSSASPQPPTAASSHSHPSTAGYSWLDKRPSTSASSAAAAPGLALGSGRAAPKEGQSRLQSKDDDLYRHDDEDEFSRTRTKDKYRVVYSDHQRLELEKEFHFSRYITIRRKAELAQALSLSERQVKIWFQNRRAKERKQLKKRDDLIQKEKLDASVGLHPGHPGQAGAAPPPPPPPHMFAMPMLHHGMAHL